MSLVKDKVALVTGSSQGLGEAMVRRLHEEGATVIIADVAVENGKKLADELGEQAEFMELDVTSKDNWEKVFQQVEEKHNRLDILVNNAGIAVLTPFEEMTEEEYMKTFDINQRGVFLGTQAAIKLMKKGEGGSIVNLSSISGLVASAGGASYNSTKFAVRGLTKVAALENAKNNIRVNSVHPGVIETTILKAMDDDLRQQTEAAIPMGRVGQPKEIANLVLFLASDESSYCTGAEFIADGGYTIQ